MGSNYQATDSTNTILQDEFFKTGTYKTSVNVQFSYNISRRQILPTGNSRKDPESSDLGSHVGSEISAVGHLAVLL